MNELTELTEEQRTRLWEGKCADCEGKLLEGPSGGCNVNVKCDTCGNRFNICVYSGTFAERI